MRADDDDRPRFVIDAETARHFNMSTREPINADAGLECEIPSTQAPEVLRLWSARLTGDVDPVHVPKHSSSTAPAHWESLEGDCSELGVAYDRWQLGDLGGWLLCREEFGDAVIEWSYDGSRLLATAIRRDGDLAALLRWWTAEARLLRP